MNHYFDLRRNFFIFIAKCNSLKLNFHPYQAISKCIQIWLISRKAYVFEVPIHVYTPSSIIYCLIYTESHQGCTIKSKWKVHIINCYAIIFFFIYLYKFIGYGFFITIGLYDKIVATRNDFCRRFPNIEKVHGDLYFLAYLNSVYINLCQLKKWTVLKLQLIYLSLEIGAIKFKSYSVINTIGNINTLLVLPFAHSFFKKKVRINGQKNGRTCQYYCAYGYPFI